MGGLALTVIAAGSLLAYQTTAAAGAQAVSQEHLPLRKLDNTGDRTYLGCFIDTKEDRILEHKLTDEESTTAEFCHDYCADMDAPLMATQFGVECWCGADADIEYERHGRGEEGQCDYACAGDENENEVCGGYYAFDLYLITPRETPEGAFDDDIVQIIDVVGDVPGGERWADSYSVGDKCYMQTTFDHDIGDVEVDTPRGTMTINALFDALEPGPGSEGRPLYNDIQCGNGPPNTAGDEVDCPGLVEYGRAGCGQIGPMWDLSELDTIGPMWDR